MAADSVEEGICSIKHDNGTATEFYLKKCPTGYNCSSDNNVIKNCEAKYSLKLPGENCNFHFDCYSGICTDNKCEEIKDTEKCEDNWLSHMQNFVNGGKRLSGLSGNWRPKVAPTETSNLKKPKQDLIKVGLSKSHISVSSERK